MSFIFYTVVVREGVCLLGMIAAVGLSSLQHCDMSSSRNLFIVGLSLFTGLAVPQWISSNQSAIQTGLRVIAIMFVLFIFNFITARQST